MKSSMAFLMASLAASAFGAPNIVFILTDDMSWVGTSVAMVDGNSESKSDFYQTPNIEKLSEQGMRFSNAYSPASLCTPTRAAILTGKTPAALHMTTPGGIATAQDSQKLIAPEHITEFPESETTIAEALKERGYATAHFGKWHLGKVSPGEHGFDEHDGATGNRSGGTDENPKDIFGVTERAVEFMKKQKEGPFYVQLSHYAVHVPLQCLEESEEKFSNVRKGERHDDVEFAAMTWDLDTSIGLLMEEIDQLGLADNTYVVLMSDNGGAASPRSSQNLPLAGGKGTLYEGGIRVPLIVRGPGIEADDICSENVIGCDLFPTFCEWADVPSIGKIEGSSLISLLTGSGSFQRVEEGLLFHYPHYGKGPMQKPQSAILSKGWKLVRDLETGSVQLFNLEEDCCETNDLSKKMPEKSEKLEALLNERLKQVGAQMAVENPDYDPNAESSTKRGGRRQS